MEVNDLMSLILYYFSFHKSNLQWMLIFFLVQDEVRVWCELRKDWLQTD